MSKKKLFSRSFFHQNRTITMYNEKIRIQRLICQDTPLIGIHIAANQNDARNKLGTIVGRQWHDREHIWSIPYTRETYQQLIDIFGDKNIDTIITPEPTRVTPPQYFSRVMPLKSPETLEKIAHQQAATRETYETYETYETHNNFNKPTHPQTSQDTAQHRFQVVDIAAQLHATDNSETLLQQPLQIPNKILIRFAQFWEGRIRLDCPYRQDWIDKIKFIKGNFWHKDHKCWSLPYSPMIVEILNNLFGDSLEYDLTPLTEYKNAPNVQGETQNSKHETLHSKLETPPQYRDEISRLEEKMTLKRMAVSTIKLYKSCFGQFLQFYNSKHPKDITHEEIIKYILHRIKTDKISPSVQNNFINAIKCYYEFVLGRDRTYYDLQRPKKPFQLPNVLDQAEVIKLFQAVDNLKHRCILLAIYSAGLRLSEVVNLRIADIRRTDKSIFVKAGKGKKDRYTLLSDTLLVELERYWQAYKPKYWLFEGQTGGQYSVRSVELILRKAVTKSGVNPYATVHTLRHSFATHLVISGLDILTLQKLLGHESPVTTEIYVHLSHQHMQQIQSPLDRLKF